MGVGAKTKGNPKAPIHIVEYTDFECPACTKGAILIKDYMEKYPARVYLEYRHFPLPSIHRYAMMSAAFAECAAEQDKFWPFHDVLVVTRQSWLRSLSVGARLLSIGEDLGLDTQQLQACIKKPETEERILADVKEGELRGVRATPTYFINGEMTVGVKSLRETFEKIIKGQEE